jgi:hypothetical protein
VHTKCTSNKTKRLEEVLCRSVARKRNGVDADATAGPTPFRDLLHHGFTKADPTGIGEDVDVGEVANRSPVMKLGSRDCRVTNDCVVDGADEDLRVGVGMGLANADVERLGPGLPLAPDIATAVRPKFVVGRGAERDHNLEFVAVGWTRRDFHGFSPGADECG